jgi:hypothetical protein
MKKLLYIIPFLFVAGAKAQQPGWDNKSYFEKKQQKLTPLAKIQKKNLLDFPGGNRITQPWIVTFTPKARLSHTLPNGNKVFLLQDYMACIVPDMSQFNMPEVSRELRNKILLPEIPNTSPPIQIIPKDDK